MLTKETVEEAAVEISEAIYQLDKTLNTRADATGYTFADSLSNIAYQLERIADAMEKEKGR